MFVGHYSVAFACRTERNEIPLWVLFVAVQFLDYIWATLVLLGIEKLRVIKGFTAGSMLDSYFHPYSHSLVTAVIWSVVAAFVYKTVCSRHDCHYSTSVPLMIGLAVFSHWILDLVRTRAISRSTTTLGKSASVCGTIATRSLRWQSRCLLAGSLFISREMRCRQFAREL